MSTNTESGMDKAARIRKYGEVFTPQPFVDRMCDMLETESPDCWEIGATFLEPCCGDGIFVMEILRRKFACCVSRKDYTAALKSVWAMDIQERNVDATIANVCVLCEKYFKPTKEEYQIISDHVILCDSLKVMRMMNELNETEEADGKAETKKSPRTADREAGRNDEAGMV